MERDGFNLSLTLSPSASEFKCAPLDVNKRPTNGSQFTIRTKLCAPNVNKRVVNGRLDELDTLSPEEVRNIICRET